ncbi:cob(I)yrinic acid a,c-diamide adenosyltransferase [Prochlorococcus sp. MIT 1223]|uniref:cob(I)yrinic acid a,c-diamide adenosyltransferase n=1 Tax=Prochlorococcus sp. MIT 1223 TaxID=3096217 RepID=UPI002A75C205|nr:cob(I)yrinic acid a,c-diamide adenosyltransferase [Prochlorococcus sp. MIT 1223]
MTSSLWDIKDYSDSRAVGLQPVHQVSSKFPLHLVVPQGQLQIHTASFRGSFSIVLSEAIRAAGLGSNVLIAQFLKGGVNQGPNQGINLCGGLTWIRPDLPFCLNNKKENTSTQKETDIRKAIGNVWERCKESLSSKAINRLVLDEIGMATSLGYIEKSDLISTLKGRPAETDLILTGPSIPEEVLAMADQVTELR